MADQNPTAHGAIPDPPSNADEDLEDQALVLDRLLVHWPTHLQDSDLQRELQAGGDEFQQRDRVERAVHQLWWAGLVMRCGPAVVPTRAALHYHLLIDETSVSRGPAMLNPRTRDPEFAEVFGKNLARHREAKGISQEDLGFVAGLHRTAVGQLERGERVARSDTLLRLSCSLGIDPSVLFEGLGWKPAIFSKGELIVQLKEQSNAKPESQ